MNKDFENFCISAATSVWGVAKRRFLDLGREEKGAALVITLAMFFLMYLACCGVFAVSTAVKERIHLQNAADAAAYSAAVVQADTLSRIATINRAMAWTYVQMTRRQMDYIVLRWLRHTVEHYQKDSDEAKAYNREGILGSPCGSHRSEGYSTWFIGASKKGPMNAVQLNGWNLSNYLGVDMSIPGLSEVSGLVGAGSVQPISKVKAALTGYEDLAAYKGLKGESGDSSVSSLGNIRGDALTLITAINDFSLNEPESNVETAASISEMLSGLGVRSSGCSPNSERGSESLLGAQIVLDRLNIALMNICERRLAVEMPEKIRVAVQNIVHANVPEYMADDCFYFLEQNENPIADENIRNPYGVEIGGVAAKGYFDNLYNNPEDEKRFLRFAGYNRSLIEEFMMTKGSSSLTKIEENLLSRVAAGLDQWFVRGNGHGRTDDWRGLQRSYKHWAEGPFANVHATHNPLPPSCWNTDSDLLRNSPASIALYSEWVWWSDVWSCPRVLFKRIHIHLCPHKSKVWPMKMECEHNKNPGLFGAAELKDAAKTLADLAGAGDDLVNMAKGMIEGRKTEGADGSETTPELTEEDIAKLESKYSNYNVGSASAGKTGDLSGFNSSGIENYQDGCLMAYPPLMNSHVVGCARLYADAPPLYNSCYVGERAKPLILRMNYFGRAGTITVGLSRQNRNVWGRILGMIQGIFTAFDSSVSWTWAFASAKAGYVNKGDAPSLQSYQVDWQDANQAWNLCQSDWDAVFVPVRHAHSLAYNGRWDSWQHSVYSGWIDDVGDWKPVNETTDNRIDGWNAVEAPRGMLTVGGARGALAWEGLDDVTYH